MVKRETPWMPSKEHLDALPDEQVVVLISPAGVSHLVLDAAGQWWHLQSDGQHRGITAGMAAQLRPSDVGLIIKTAMVWTWKQGTGNARSGPMIDELADGVQAMILAYAMMAGQRARARTGPLN